MGTSLFEQFQKEQGEPKKPASLYDQFQAEQPSLPPSVRPDVTSALARNRKNPSGDLQAALRNPGKQARFIGEGLAVNVLNAAQGIPGMEALEAGAGMVGSHLPGAGPALSYRQSLDALRGATGEIPAPLRTAEKFAGGGLLAKALPLKTLGQAAGSGAALAGGDVALQANPDVSLGERAFKAPIAAAAGAALGGGLFLGGKALNKGREFLDIRKRANAVPDADVQAFQASDARKAAGIQNYGEAAAQGEAAGGTSPGLAKELEYHRTKPFVDRFRASDEGQGADDATTARAVFKSMGKKQRTLEQKIAQKGEYDPDLELEITNLKNAKSRLKTAMSTASEKPPLMLDVAGETTVVPGKAAGIREIPPERQIAAKGETVPEKLSPSRLEYDKGTPRVELTTPSMRVQTAPAEQVPAPMESFPFAVSENKRLADKRQAVTDVGDATVRAMAGASVKGKKLEDLSNEAFRRSIRSMDPDQAKEALTIALGRAKEGFKLTGTTPMHTKSGIISTMAGPMARINRLNPFIEMLDKQAGNEVKGPMTTEKLMRLLGLANAGVSNPE